MKTTLLAFLMCITLTAQGQLLEPNKADDRLHFALGVFSGEAGMIFNDAVLKTDCEWCFALGTSFLAGATKETIDSMNKNNRFDGGELLATTIGGGFSYGFRRLLEWIGAPPQVASGIMLFGSLAYIGFEMSFVF